MVEQAQRKLGEVSYIQSNLELLRGPMPMLFCATPEMMYFFCSKEQFLVHSIDFTFDEVLGEMDDWDDHAIDFELGLTLPFFRIFARLKSAEATEYYLDNLNKVLESQGYEFRWGESITCLIVDFHYGQALGILRHLIKKFGHEEGVAMFLKLITGCGVHLKKVRH